MLFFQLFELPNKQNTNTNTITLQHQQIHHFQPMNEHYIAVYGCVQKAPPIRLSRCAMHSIVHGSIFMQ